jgi:hypothetical protein
MAKRQIPKRLFKGKDRVTRYVHDRNPKRRMEKMSREHEDLLQNIEAVLVQAYRDDPDVDDRVATGALRACINGVTPDDPVVDEVADGLRAIREFREDIAEKVWLEALRVVDDSVRLHSRLEPGETSYLDFAEPYIP